LFQQLCFSRSVHDLANHLSRKNSVLHIEFIGANVVEAKFALQSTRFVGEPKKMASVGGEPRLGCRFRDRNIRPLLCGLPAHVLINGRYGLSVPDPYFTLCGDSMSLSDSGNKTGGTNSI